MTRSWHSWTRASRSCWTASAFRRRSGVGLNGSQPAALLAIWGERATVLRSGRETFVPFHRQLPQARVTVEEPVFEAAALAWART